MLEPNLFFPFSTKRHCPFNLTSLLVTYSLGNDNSACPCQLQCLWDKFSNPAILKTSRGISIRSEEIFLLQMIVSVLTQKRNPCACQWSYVFTWILFAKCSNQLCCYLQGADGGNLLQLTTWVKSVQHFSWLQCCQVLLTSRSSAFIQKLWKISLQYIPMLKGNFIPFYRCSDTSNELNKNMFPFLRIFVWLNARITSCCLPDDLRLLKSILCFRPLSASKICILSLDRY